VNAKLYRIQEHPGGPGVPRAKIQVDGDTFRNVADFGNKPGGSPGGVPQWRNTFRKGAREVYSTPAETSVSSGGFSGETGTGRGGPQGGAHSVGANKSVQGVRKGKQSCEKTEVSRETYGDNTPAGGWAITRGDCQHRWE